MPPEPRVRRWRGAVVPAAIGAVLQAGYIGYLVRSHVPAAGPYAVLAAVGLATLVAVARWPRVVIASGAAAIAALLVVPVGPPIAALVLAAALGNAAARGARWWAVGTAGAAAVLPVLVLVETREPVAALRAVGECIVLAVAVAIGERVRERHRRAVLRRTAAEADARMRVEQERVRIARELHDVLAHSLSAISVQAGVGLHLAEADPAAARAALEAIRTASTTALSEVRGVIGVLRGDDVPRAPEPDLDGLGRLVADAAALGLDARLDDRMLPRPAAATQLALHRIVQESLTNAARHASGRAVLVTLERTAAGVEARVRDTGGRRPSLPADAVGRGVIGMRERAAQVGGTLDLLPHDDGLEVVARVPGAAP